MDPWIAVKIRFCGIIGRQRTEFCALPGVSQLGWLLTPFSLQMSTSSLTSVCTQLKWWVNCFEKVKVKRFWIRQHLVFFNLFGLILLLLLNFFFFFFFYIIWMCKHLGGKNWRIGISIIPTDQPYYRHVSLCLLCFPDVSSIKSGLL